MPAKKPKSKILNLLPQNKFEASLTGRILKWTLSTFRAIVIFVELIVIIGFLARFWLDIEHSDLNDEIEEKQAIIASYAKLEKDFKYTQARLALWDQDSSLETHFSLLLNKVVTMLPPEIRLVSLSNQNSVITINLTSTAEQPVAQFIANLKQEPEFATISVSQVKSEKGSGPTSITLTTTPPSLEETIPPETSPNEGEGV